MAANIAHIIVLFWKFLFQEYFLEIVFFIAATALTFFIFWYQERVRKKDDRARQKRERAQQKERQPILTVHQLMGLSREQRLQKLAQWRELRHDYSLPKWSTAPPERQLQLQEARQIDFTALNGFFESFGQ